MTDDLIVSLLLGYFALVILSIFLSSKLLSKLQTEARESWVKLGCPKSLFAPSINNFNVYKQLFFKRNEIFSKNPDLATLGKYFCISTLLTQTFFFVFVIVFIAGGQIEKP